MIDRRHFLALTGAAPLAGAADTPSQLARYFETIYEGFLRNARGTSASFAVCDFEGGTKLQGTVAASGKTYVSVSRMLPALAAWHLGGYGNQSTAGVLTAMLTASFDPSNADYWGAASPGHSDQRQVEASIVAWSLWLLRRELVPKLSPAQRSNLQGWLAACCKVPVRNNNWAWFTAVNQAARLSLSKDWQEFRGDRKAMDEDLAFLETLAAPGSDGWYTDSLQGPVYDYYNFWVFASHYLYWRKITGTPSQAFDARLRAFLRRTPLFFGANGSHVLYGRSLIYRWAVLTPLVLAYSQGLWPHSPGLLRAIVRRNLEYFWSRGAYDPKTGRLLESLTPAGSRAVCEPYIDNGHPYWCMQAFAFFLIPRNDPFWTAPEEPLPVEAVDFDERFEGAKMRLTGNARTGEVRWYQGSLAPHYHDKYGKVAYSTHFAFGIASSEDRLAQDQALVFIEPKTGRMARRSAVERTALTTSGLDVDWIAELDGLRFRIATSIRLDHGREVRRHVIAAPPEALQRGIEVLEGSYALGLPAGEEFVQEKRGEALIVRSSLGVVAARMTNASVEVVTDENIVHGRTAIIRSILVLSQAETVLESSVVAMPGRNVSLPPVI